MSKVKRTHVYIQHPLVYEIAGCPNDPTLDRDGLPRLNDYFASHKVEHSEWEHYLWCYDCEIDFIPDHYGIFDGPIGLGAAKIMGICFDRIEIATGKRVIKPDFDDKEKLKEWNETWQ